MQKFFERIIQWCFYLLFLLVPLIFVADTSELFEFNKMWITFGLTIFIVGAWISKSILARQVKLQKTPLDVPILLFLLSQLIATIFSLDSRVSWWGYYSRFNGGFLSLLTYAVLYFAFVSNIGKKQLMSYIYTILIGGIVVALWGLPAHFGYDPTCLIFRGSLDVSCWTFAFQPKVRIFSTLGQPDWLAAYLVALMPLAMASAMHFWKKKKYIWTGLFAATTILFYLDLIYTRAKSGFLGIVVATVVFIGIVAWLHRKELGKTHFIAFLRAHWMLPGILASILLVTFFVGSPIDQLAKFTLPGIMQNVKSAPSLSKTSTNTTSPAPQPAGEFGGTDSGKIRLFVWQGALSAWLAHPIFGTGVETFAFAYYQYRPAGHNLTSEWDYLYNKAHNEYLNYLTTTGIVGLGTYLVMIGFFLFFAVKSWMKNSNEKEEPNYLTPALLAAYISILVTNFFGFSVVIMNIFLFLFPAFVLLQEDGIGVKMFTFPKQSSAHGETSGFQWVCIAAVTIVGGYFLFVLLQMWSADKLYAYGYNLDHAGAYQNAYTPLHQAVQMSPNEPVFQDELAVNDAVIASALASQNNATTAAQLAQEAVAVNTNLVNQHPNNVTYWKSRVRILYMLSQINPSYLSDALIAIQKAAQLAPTDAKIAYNLGLIYGQSGHIPQAIAALEQTIKLKPDYKDAYYALGLFYHAQAVDSSGRIVNPESLQKAIDTMHFILEHFGTNDTQVNAALKAWNAQ